MTARPALGLLLLGSTLLASAGCAKDSDAESGSSDIVGGTPATDFPEAATIDFQKSGSPFSCSGSIIAPRVALTAGHCVVNASNWFVHAGAFSTTASTATVLDYTTDAENVNFAQHDIGLVFLDDPIVLSRYPTITSSPVPDGSTVFNVGRIMDGTFTDSLFGASSVVQNGAAVGATFDYTSSQVIQPGDSGGPDFAFGTHTIVAVNSAATPRAQEFLARVDLVHDFIEQQITLHGGGGAESPIPNDTLFSVDEYEIVPAELNCRSAAGTDATIEQRLFQGELVQATTLPSRPRVALAPNGDPWLLVQPPAGGPCYVSANFKFLAPQGAAPPPTPSRAEPLPLTSGLYGSLALIVHNGMLTGGVNEGACVFTVTGPIPNVNPIRLDILTPGGKQPAELEFVDDSTLSFRTSNLPAACVGFFDPIQVATGITQVRRADLSPNVLAFRMVQAPKAFFHDQPSSPPRSSFVVRGDVVRQLGVNTNGFALVTFSNPQGVTTQGFLAEADLVSLGLFSADL